jgi:hypothetical protein
LPAGKHVGLPGAIKDDRTRPLKGTDSHSSRKQRPNRKHGNQQNDDHISAHRRRDYTTSYITTLKVTQLCNGKCSFIPNSLENQRFDLPERPFGVQKHLWLK